MSTNPTSPPSKTRVAISRRTFLTTSAAAAGALVVGLTLRGRFHHSSSETPKDPFNLKTAVEPLLVLHPLESTNTCSRWGFHQFGALRSSR
jgi:hypothetical protein